METSAETPKVEPVTEVTKTVSENNVEAEAASAGVEQDTENTAPGDASTPATDRLGTLSEALTEEVENVKEVGEPQLSGEPAAATKPPGRASNDPREVKRRGRENVLRNQGVSIQPRSGNSQDSTDGSSSS